VELTLERLDNGLLWPANVDHAFFCRLLQLRESHGREVGHCLSFEFCAPRFRRYEALEVHRADDIGCLSIMM
jgi:hypothetical protein